jgi:hypothetical protein
MIMRCSHGIAVALAAVLVVPAVSAAQDASKPVAGGGISAPGWMGKIDANEAARGAKLEDAKLVTMGQGLHVTTGPAVVYWNPANTASGNYTVEATFAEREFMGLNDHAHPYGIVIGGNKMGTDEQSYLYCAAYGNGNFIVRGFGPAAFQLNGGRQGQASEAVNKATAKGQPVTQKIAVKVSADKVECIINDKVAGTFPKADVVGTGKLASTDGIWGIRFGHNTDAHVSGLKMTKN